MKTAFQKIDVHAHILPDFYISYLAKMGVTGNTGAKGMELPAWNVEQHLALMDKHGIQAAITSVTAPGVFFGDEKAATDMARQCNEFSAKMIKDYPGRFGSFAILPLPDVGAAIAEMNYAFDTLKMDGVTMLTSIDNKYLGDPDFDPIFYELNRRKAIVFIHPTIPPHRDNLKLSTPDFVVEFVFDTTRAVANLVFSGTLERYPDIRFIISHAGGAIPYLAYRMQLGWFTAENPPPNDPVVYLKKLYFDTALSASPHNLRSLQELADPSHIVYGSDYPFAPETVTQMTNDGVHSYDGFDEKSLSLLYKKNVIQLFPRFKTMEKAPRQNQICLF